MTNILITGGTGSLGQELVGQLLEKDDYEKIVVLSRDDHKQELMKSKFNSDRLRFFIGDVRDRNRLITAFRDVNYVIHTAALKVVPSGEYNPTEYIATNIIGSQNVVEAADLCGIEKVIAISTDKAVNPINLYGATKLCMEKLVLAANNMLPRVRYSIVRYGNVANANGSVIPIFKKAYETNAQFPITHNLMTRFWIELDVAASYVLNCLELTEGGETWIPTMPSFNIMDLAQAFVGKNRVPDIKYIGVRDGEKLHEQITHNKFSNSDDQIFLSVKQLRNKLIKMEVI